MVYYAVLGAEKIEKTVEKFQKKITMQIGCTQENYLCSEN